MWRSRETALLYVQGFGEPVPINKIGSWFWKRVIVEDHIPVGFIQVDLQGNRTVVCRVTNFGRSNDMDAHDLDVMKS